MAIHAWTTGRVPNGFWDVRANRRKYLLWLGKRLKFTKKTDWYNLTRECFLKNHGGGLLATRYNHSPIVAMRDFDPKYDWKPWLFKSSPQRFWRDQANRNQYFDWLGKQLRFKTDEDWYSLTQQDFIDYYGHGLLTNYYKGSAIAALKDYKPHIEFEEWLFYTVPQGFWRHKENRVRYMAWLGKRLGYKKPEDWYHITRKEFNENYGGRLLQIRKSVSPLWLLREYLPKYDWQEWLFVRVPNGFWKTRSNREKYITWLGKKLGFRKQADWYKLTTEDIRDSGGGTLLSIYYNNSLFALLQDTLPKYKKWDREKLYIRGKISIRPRGKHKRGRKDPKQLQLWTD